MNSLSPSNSRPIILAAVIATVVFSYQIPRAHAAGIPDARKKAEDRQTIKFSQRTPTIQLAVYSDPAYGGGNASSSTASSSLLQMPGSIAMPTTPAVPATVSEPNQQPAAQPLAFNFQLPQVIQQAQNNLSQDLQSLPLLTEWETATDGSPYGFKPLSAETTLKLNLASGALLLAGGSLAFGKGGRKKYNRHPSLAEAEKLKPA